MCEVAKSWDGIREVARSQTPDGILGHGKSLGFHSKRDEMSEGLRREMIYVLQGPLSFLCGNRVYGVRVEAGRLIRKLLQ